MPYALSIGVDLGSFWRLTPHSLTLIGEGYNMAYKRQLEYDNTMAHLQGIYVRDALMSTVGNMLSGKRSQRFDYPEQPYDLNIDGKKEEREKEGQLQAFVANLNNAMNSFNLSKEQG